MKKNVNRRNFSDLDKFDKRQKKHAVSKQKDSKNKYSIYDDFNDEDEELLNDNYGEDFEDR